MSHSDTSSNKVTELSSPPGAPRIKSRRFVVTLGLLLAIVALAVVAPVVAGLDPIMQSLGDRLLPPGSESSAGTLHLLGTDQYGRDVAARLLVGARYSLLIAVGATLISLAVGAILALLAGQFGGKAEAVVMRTTDMQLAIPAILLALLFVTVFGKSIWVMIVVLALAGWPQFARVLFSIVQKTKTHEYVVAAQTLGVSRTAIMVRHIAPAMVPEALVLTTIITARNMIEAAALDFLGLGLPSPLPSWGEMMAAGHKYVVVAWWLIVLPGALITVTVLCLNLVSNDARKLARR